jgi:hypothetical protein
MELPAHMICGPDLSDLLSEIYPNIGLGAEWRDSEFLERGILCPRNSQVDEINAQLLSLFPGESRVFYSADKARGDSETELYPVEYLHSLNFGGISPSRLELKTGVPLMLLRNIDPERGLCNGTRLRLVQMRTSCLQVRILTGPCQGELALISKIKISTNPGQLSFELERTQFPVRLGFAMTINKSQGQSLKVVGLDLRTPVFGHGQLYVGVSRGSNWGRVKVLLEEGKRTCNIVYKDVLLD